MEEKHYFSKVVFFFFNLSDFFCKVVFVQTYLGVNSPSLGTVDKNPPANVEDTGSIPGPGRFHMTWNN